MSPSPAEALLSCLGLGTVAVWVWAPGSGPLGLGPWVLTVPSPPAESLLSSLGLGAVVGLGLGGLLLFLLMLDVSCFFLRRCGLLMCVTRSLCSKKSSTNQGKETEEGGAAYL